MSSKDKASKVVDEEIFKNHSRFTKSIQLIGFILTTFIGVKG